MNFNNHSYLAGKHAFLGASKYHWIGYDEEKLAGSYLKHLKVLRGTQLHDLAERCITLNQKLPKNKKTLNMYVNDAIGFGMTPEQVLFYSNNCFGTADAISFRDNMLRIHDLKTGDSKTHIEQLVIYAALFCLEYHHNPKDINVELRIYQSNEVLYHNPEPEEIQVVMDKIVSFDKIIDDIKAKEM